MLPCVARARCPAREHRALTVTNQALPEAIGRIYVERYFPPRRKARVQAIRDHVVAAFCHRVDAAAWMTEPTKTIALTKLKAMYFGVGYPEKWQDD